MKFQVWNGVMFSMLAAARAATAGPIIVEIDGVAQTTTYNNNDDISIDVGTFTGVKRVRIYDSTLDVNGLPDESIGKVTIDGTPSGATSRLDFWVTGSTSFPTNPNILISSRGALSFGASDSDGLEISNTTLRRRTRVAIAVVNNIRGEISAGQMFRIQNGIASGGNTTYSGEISANINAIAQDQDWRLSTSDPVLPKRAIEEVNCIGLLKGNVIALGDSNYQVGVPSTYATIGSVIVRGEVDFPGYDPTGNFNRRTAIIGDIKAEKGSIIEIYSDGSIGKQDNPNSPGEDGRQSEFLAADGILRVETRPYSGTTAPASNWLYADQNFQKILVRANIIANVKNSQGWTPQGDLPGNDGRIEIIATQGSIDGNISANNLQFFQPNKRAGIFAFQRISGTIRIEYLVDGADIVSPGGLSEVYIGRQLRGSIVGKILQAEQGGTAQTGPCDTQLITIGYPDEAALDLPPYATARTPGFAGSYNIVEIPFPTDEKWLPQDCFYDSTVSRCGDSGSFDSTIRSNCLQNLFVANMTIIRDLPSTTTATVEMTVQPRVEVDIGNELIIGELRCGSVASGQTYLATVNQPATWDNVTLGCVGTASEVWLRGNGPNNFAKVTVLGSMLGEVWMDYFYGGSGTADEQTLLTIGEGLTPFDNEICECITPRDDQTPCVVERTRTANEGLPSGAPSSSEISTESTPPRGAADLPDPTESANGPVIAGNVAVFYLAAGDEVPGLFNGQIILHANNNTQTQDASKWQGSIQLGVADSGLNPFVFDTYNDPSDPDDNLFVGPLYQSVPGANYIDGGLGLGAIGLAPFAIHRQASELLNVDFGPPTCMTSGSSASLSRSFSRPGPNDDVEEYCETADYVEVVFYGPVKSPSGNIPPLKVKMMTPGDGGGCTSTNAVSTYTTKVSFEEGARRMKYIGEDGFYLPGTRYTLEARGSAASDRQTNGLRCDKMLTTSTVFPIDFDTDAETEWFRIEVACPSDPCFPRIGDPEDPAYCEDIDLPEAYCDDIDFNNDTSFFDPQDIEAFLSVYSEGPCVPATATCNDIDFNNDESIFDPCDIDAFLLVYSEGPCTLCGV